MEAEMRREIGRAGVFLPTESGTVSPELYQAASLVLAPFRRDYSGRAVLPAWALARPIAVLTGTVPSEFVLPDKNGWVSEAEPDALSEAVLAAFADLEAAAWMGRNGRVAAETAFTWDVGAKRLVELYSRRRILTRG